MKNKYFVLYRFSFGSEWYTYNARRGGLTRKEAKGVLEHFKDDKDIEIKVLTEPLFSLLKR